MRARSLCVLKAGSRKVSTHLGLYQPMPNTVLPISKYTSSSTFRTLWTQHTLEPTNKGIGSNRSISENGSELPKPSRKAFIALGSNLGDRIGMIERACNEISLRGIKIKKTSSLWETEPMYVLDQASFINGVCEVSGKPRISRNTFSSELSKQY